MLSILLDSQSLDLRRDAMKIILYQSLYQRTCRGYIYYIVRLIRYQLVREIDHQSDHLTIVQ